MSEKRLLGRIVHKHDTEEHWLLATGFTPMAGEIIIYDVDANYNYVRVKVGDGVQNVNDLPFIDEAAIHESKTYTDAAVAAAISEIEFITDETIDAICGSTIYTASEVEL